MTALRIDVAFTWSDVTESRARGSIAVVIDVLRATTMIASLLHAGASEVWATKEIDDARRLAGGLDGALLAGERGGLPPEGFDMGNSPLEIQPAKVHGRPVVITTTNGTAAIERAAAAEVLVTAAFVNVSAVARLLVNNLAKSRGNKRADDQVSNLLIVCAGTEGEFSLDDCLCAGMLVARLEETAAGRDADGAPWNGRFELSDSALAARILYETRRGRLKETLTECRHGRRLAGLGLGGDIEFAAAVDRFGIVPVRKVRRGHGPSSGRGDVSGYVLVAAVPGADLFAI